MICFVAAMEKEFAPLIAKSKVKEKHYGFAHLYECELQGKPFLVMITGIGKVSAGIGLAALFGSRDYIIDRVLNIGVGGSLRPDKAGLLSCLIGTEYIQHDMDTSPIGDPVGFVSGVDMIEFPSDKMLVAHLSEVCKALFIPSCKGLICSGDQFIVKKEQIARILKHFPDTMSIDMESAAYAQACYVYKVPFVAARFVSDTGHAGEYEEYFPACQAKIMELTEAIVKDTF